ncbi:hypothetical protein [Bacillus velezensis]|uniref:hypothetical protein n=2 Tax=Bacillus velezensis TaxID=492670 RepID=UPI000C6DC53E|nr:hypothetical protein [Bacillus velezensis]AUG37189.1 hypothetical protein CXP43_16260 [Bacillus velezensis]AUS17048.1 hypothetical protein C0W57_13070 [Bacillus velezensis]MCY7682079.1 hypothetical protein [Bacillus velezensis]MEC3797990.1 hypothetical protein [Bacillus velezensis]QRL10389.1 hypothetical protein GKO36_16225 [Bacillus velezensis]
MVCRLCRERGKTWHGSDPVCAFENGVFSPDNWACATMGKLRRLSEELGHSDRDDDSCGSIGYVPLNDNYAPDTYEGFGGYVVMMWYKERGRVGNAVFMTDERTEPLTIEHAEIAIKTAEKWLRVSE